jgi:hypothetical protein
MAAAILVPAGVALFTYDDDLSASNELPATAAAYRATGLPWTPDEVAPAVPADQNAAPVLRLAVQQTKGADAQIVNVQKLLEANDLDGARDLAQIFEPALKTASYAIQRPEANWQRDWKLGPLATFPEFAYLKSLSKEFALRAEIRARSGDVQGAAGDIVAIRKLAALTGQDPTLIASLVQVAEESIAMNAAQRAASFVADDASALKTIRAAVEEPTEAPDFARAMRGEAFGALQVGRNEQFQRPGNFEPNTDGTNSAPPIDASRLLTDGLPPGIHTRAEMDRVIGVWADYGKFAKTHGNDPGELSGELQRLADALERKQSTSYAIAKIIFPVFSQAGDIIVTTKALRLSTDALLGAMIQHAATGRYPDSIDGIPGKWTDPFTGSPLHIKATPTDGGFRVYSDGTTRIDHGGTFSWEVRNLSTQSYDIGASFPPRPIKVN